LLTYALHQDYALQIIEEGHRSWQQLMAGQIKTASHELSLMCSQDTSLYVRAEKLKSQHGPHYKP